MAGDLWIGLSSEGAAVAEAELADDEPLAVVAEARRRGAELLWLHTNDDLSSLGFSHAGGYTRLRAQVAPEGAPLPRLADDDFARTMDRAYHGLWGHKLVPADATPPTDAIVLGLYSQSEPCGLCTVYREARLVDGPGLVHGARDPDNYARLLLGACAVLGSGPVDLDSWGDDAEVIRAYVELGFGITEQVAGWQLSLC